MLIIKAVVTRVAEAEVSVDNEIIGRIEKGFLVLLGVQDDDTEEECKKLSEKVMNLRVFEDENQKMNLALNDVGGDLLIVSQFTLLANPMEKGNRPSFIRAARPEKAIPMYEMFINLCKARGFHVETGKFGADMQVKSINDGPVTLLFDTKKGGA